MGTATRVHDLAVVAPGDVWRRPPGSSGSPGWNLPSRRRVRWSGPNEPGHAGGAEGSHHL